jgi:hypothetical protein
VRIGFASIYSWRPHVEHIYFLADLARRAGHEVFFLTCDADLPDCYTRELRDRPAWLECATCRAGGIRSYTQRDVSSIGQLAATAADVPADIEWARSSASTLGRFESDADFASAEFTAIAARLQPAVQMSYRAASHWIARNRLDAVCVFNGRMDATRAIFEAARAAGIRVVSAERTWFGDGLQLLPDENCLGLQAIDRMVADWKDRPLTRRQALAAAWPVARRFLRTNSREWRAHNTNARIVQWPIATSRRRILLIPSSSNEVRGHADWEAGWQSPLDAYDALLAHLCLAPEDVLLRGHPIWSEKVGKKGGEYCERYYADWARRRSIRYIPSSDNTSTLGLIEQSEAVVVVHGTAALEAGFLGKQVIAIAPSAYQAAGMRDPAMTPAQLATLRLWVDMEEAEHALRQREAARQTLRFLYTMLHRIPQYSQFVRAEATTRFRYDFNADPRRFIDLLTTGTLQPDDAEHAASPDEEQAVLDAIQARTWEQLAEMPAHERRQYQRLRRRVLYRLVDWVAERKPVGDR